MLNAEVLKQLARYKIDHTEGFLSNYEGERKSNQKGQSQEFSDFRPYYLGDDIRLIDWNAYARTDEYYVKVYEEEREARITIVLDHSASMGFSESKRKLAENLVFIFAYVGLSSGDSVRLVTRSEKGQVIASPFYRGLHQYAFFQKTLDVLKWQGTDGFEFLTKEVQFTKGVTIWISDFLYDHMSEIHGQLKYKKQHVLGIQTLTEEILSPTYEGMLDLYDCESQEKIEVHCTPSALKAYHESLASHLEHVEHLFSKYGDRYLLLNVEMHDAAQVLQKLLTHSILR